MHEAKRQFQLYLMKQNSQSFALYCQLMYVVVCCCAVSDVPPTYNGISISATPINRLRLRLVCLAIPHNVSKCFEYILQIIDISCASVFFLRLSKILRYVFVFSGYFLPFTDTKFVPNSKYEIWKSHYSHPNTCHFQFQEHILAHKSISKFAMLSVNERASEREVAGAFLRMMKRCGREVKWIQKW